MCVHLTDGEISVIFQIAMSPIEESLQGKLILDSGKLAGSYFDRTVILICRHNESGSFGLILNRPLKRTLGEMARESVTEDLIQTPVYAGGPVQPECLSFLQETELQPEFEILPWLAMGHSLEDLKKRLFAEGDRWRLRIFAGYAGWASGQLENEMKTGCWITHPSSVSLVFYPKIETLWRHVLQEKGGLHRLIAECPDHPSMN